MQQPKSASLHDRSGVWYHTDFDNECFTLTSRPDATHTEWKIPVSHRYSIFSWWWAHVCPKHVERRNKCAGKNCATRWIYLQGGRLVCRQENHYHSLTA